MSYIKSGPHLGVVRRWIQRFAGNGETVIWGSQTYLQMRPVTAYDMDMLAQEIADACGRDEDKHQEQMDRLRRKSWELESQIDSLKAKLLDYNRGEDS